MCPLTVIPVGVSIHASMTSLALNSSPDPCIHCLMLPNGAIVPDIIDGVNYQAFSLKGGGLLVDNYCSYV